MGLLTTLTETHPSFLSALETLLSLAPIYSTELSAVSPAATSEEGTPEVPEGVSLSEWLLATSALRTLRSYASDLGDEWANDLQEVVDDNDQLSEDGFDSVVSLVNEAASDPLRLRAIRAREGLLPIATRLVALVDLRAVYDDAENHILIPTVVCRIEFDEDVGTAPGAATFQLPLRLLDRLETDFDRLRVILQHWRGTLPEGATPAWAWPKDKKDDGDA